MSETLIARGPDGTRRTLRIGRVLHKGGGAGRIVAVRGDADTVVKLYHDPASAQPYEAKIAAMLERRPDLPAIEQDGKRLVQVAWPQALVHDRAGTFRGFAMPFVDLSEAAPFEALMVKALRRHHDLPENYAYRLFAAQNVAALIGELHRLGHHVIDLKPQNLSVYKRSMYVAVVDCDGLSIDGGDGVRFPAFQFTDGYRAPEVVKSRLDPEALGVEQDRFALAVILFQLMNNGIHPFQGVPKRKGSALGTEQERITAGLFAYGRRENGRQGPAPGSIHGFFEDETRELFERAFTSCYRPSALEWRDHLRGLIEDGALQKCADNPAEHAHFSKGCGLCAVDKGKTARLQAARARQTVPKRRQATAARGATRPYKIITRRYRTAPTRPHRPAAPAPLGTASFKQLALQAALWCVRAMLAVVFGTRAAMTSFRPTGAAGLAGLYLVYGLFITNMALLAGFVTSLAMPSRFHALGRALMELNVFEWAESMTTRDMVQIAQGSSLLWVIGGTFVSLLVCYRISRASGTVAKTHANWLISTFWYTLPLTTLAVYLGYTVSPWGAFALMALPLWLLHRWAKGLRYLLARRPFVLTGGLV